MLLSSLISICMVSIFMSSTQLSSVVLLRLMLWEYVFIQPFHLYDPYYMYISSFSY